MEKRKWTKDEISAYKKAKGQFFYYNKDDGNIFILRELGLGFSPNWANPWLWVILVFITILIVLIFLLIK